MQSRLLKLQVLVTLFALLLSQPLVIEGYGQRRTIPRQRERVESRARENVNRVQRDPREWLSLERKLSREERVRHWELFDATTRRQVSEAIGERRMETELSKWGVTRICSSRSASARPQGFDAVVRYGNFVIIAESKSTSKRTSVENLLGNGYGYRQGSLKWARSAAEAVLRSKTVNWRERTAAEDVLRAYYEKRLCVVVFVSYHQHGRVLEHHSYQVAGPKLPF